MAKLPGYLKGGTVERGPDGITMQISLRRWHPGVVPFIWRNLDVEPRIAKPAIVFYAWLLVVCGRAKPYVTG